MKTNIQPSVLFCGNSRYFDIFEAELGGSYGFPTQHVDPARPDEAANLPNQNVRLLVYEKNSTNTDLVTAFLLKHPDIPVVGLQDDAFPEVEISFRQYSRIETSGLPQMLQVLEDCCNS